MRASLILLAPVITDMKDAATGLRWCVGEMERRYRLMAALGCATWLATTKILDAQRQASHYRPALAPG